ncbi:hypothetical protein E2562_028060 [Oryza meyeriana var. granulata]|uniref:SRP54-type proteins GTP-binding domain-containing protein n=1 Tax=Oryza meyeriana var. granulata TaxID=110450 RepID=A0A6G1C0F9_9ORYZ|nr:hypothetical protein E2562_028060 [Oryza meyeriana var. granulata]
MAAGDTFRAAARDQLEVWAEGAGSEIVIDNDKKAKPASGLHTNYGLMEELEILLVLDGTTGLNMLQQAREFNDVSVVDELGIPVKFIGVGEGLEDLQPFDSEAFVEAIFP